MAKSEVSTPAGTTGTGRRRLRNTVRAANLAMVACISDDYQPLAAEALAAVIRRQSQAGRAPATAQQLLTVGPTPDDTQDLFVATATPSLPPLSYVGRRVDDDTREEVAA